MPLVTFTPSIAPSPGTSHKPKITLNEAEFGDGYTQSSPKGLNHIRQIVSLRWDGLTETQIAELKSFFESRGGYRPFYFQPRGYATRLKWTCSDWSFSDSSPWTFSAELKQSFVTEA